MVLGYICLVSILLDNLQQNVAYFTIPHNLNLALNFVITKSIFLSQNFTGKKYSIYRKLKILKLPFNRFLQDNYFCNYRRIKILTQPMLWYTQSTNLSTQQSIQHLVRVQVNSAYPRKSASSHLKVVLKMGFLVSSGLHEFPCKTRHVPFHIYSKVLLLTGPSFKY